MGRFFCARGLYSRDGLGSILRCVGGPVAAFVRMRVRLDAGIERRVGRHVYGVDVYGPVRGAIGARLHVLLLDSSIRTIDLMRVAGLLETLCAESVRY